MLARNPRIITVATCLLAAAGAHAQINEPNATRIELQVYEPRTGTWGNTVDALLLRQIEWRVVVSYTGSNTSVSALGSMLYQPTFFSVSNSTTTTPDSLGEWRNQGTQGSQIPGSMLSSEEGEDGRSLASYGRVVYGGTAMQDAFSNRLSMFRHGGSVPSANAPAGPWLRVAGSGSTVWPYPTLPDLTYVTPGILNLINRGVSANQQSRINPVTQLTNTHHVTGTQNLVVFRGAFIPSETLADARTISLSIAAGSGARSGGLNSLDDSRYVSWQTGDYDFGGWRTGFTVSDAYIYIDIPSTGTAVSFLMVATMKCGLRCRRR